jgi:hypothetical protein
MPIGGSRQGEKRRSCARLRTIESGPRRENRSAPLEQARTSSRPFITHFGERKTVGAFPRDDDEIDAVRDEARPEPEAFPAHTLDSVSLRGVSDLPRDDDAEAAWRSRRSVANVRPHRNEQDEVAGGGSFAERLNAKEVGSAANSPDSAERERAHKEEVSRESVLNGISPTRCAGLPSRMPERLGFLLLVDGDRQTMTAFPAAVRENLGSSSGRHAGKEPVRTEAARVVGLVGAFRLSHGNKSGEARRGDDPNERAANTTTSAPCCQGPAAIWAFS